MHEDDAGRADGLGLREPAGAHRRPPPSGADGPALRPPGHRPPAARRSSRCLSTAAGRTPTRGSSAPTTRRRSRSSWRSRAHDPRRRRRRSSWSCCSRSGRSVAGRRAARSTPARLRSRLRLRLRPRLPDRRGDRAPRPATSGWTRAFAASPPTPASARGGPQRDRSPPLARSRRMPLGRVDEQTTINVGLDRRGQGDQRGPRVAARSSAEVRSLDERRAEGARGRAGRARSTTPPTSPTATCDVDVSVAADLRWLPPAAGRAGDRASPRRPCDDCGHEPQRIASGGGSDANALIPGGFDCVNLANGTERNHEPASGERRRALDGDARGGAGAACSESVAAGPARSR